MTRRLFLLPLLLAACQSTQQPAAIGMANPASVYCGKQGGRLEIRTTAAGETGFCHLPDGRVIEEWDLFRANNG